MTLRILKWPAAGLLAIVALALAAIYLVSEAEITQRYTLPSSILHAEITPQAIARGRHLAMIFGCASCHGKDMRGQMLYPSRGFSIMATNLRAFAQIATDEDFDIAVRHGLAPDARALWVMPADSYVYMRHDDLADIVAYIRSLPPDHSETPEPGFGLAARWAIMRCELQPVSPYALGLNTSLDVGPRWDGGRYLAAMSCSQCHGSDLKGSDSAPDLKTATEYSRTQFFQLLHGGPERNGQYTAMSAAAGERSSGYYDYEADALYDYLIERARVLKTAPPQSIAPSPALLKNMVCPPARKLQPN